MATLYISPTGSGLRDGSDIANAGTLGNLPAFIAAAGPGGEVLLIADQGAYQQDVEIDITAGGAAGAPVTIRGIDGSGNTMPAEIVGTRAENWSPDQSNGLPLFRLLSGADNLTFKDLSTDNFGNGVFRIGADIENLTIQHVDAANVQRFVEDLAIAPNTSATVSGLTVQNVTVAGFSGNVIHLQYDSHDVLIEDVMGDGQGQDGGLYVQGVHLDGTVHDVLFLRVQMDNAYGHGRQSEYWNGDGFATERGVYNIRFEDTSASNNTDAGYDLKSSNTVVVNAFAEGNKKNYRFWSTTITAEDCVSLNPHKLGGSSDPSHVWLRDGAIVTLDNFQASDAGAPVTLFDLSQGGAILRLVNTTVPDMYASQMLVRNGSIIEILPPDVPGPPPSETANDAPTWIEVSGATVEGSATAGTLVATLTALDPDVGDSHSFVITAGATDLFEIVGNQIRVKAGAPLNSQTESAVALNVTVTDQGGLSHSQTIVVTLTNVGETGTDGNDVLLGTAGADIMKGKKGNDIYLVNSAGDIVVELSSQGTDLVNAAIAAYTLPNDVEELTYIGSGSFAGIGNNSSNKITGGAEADNLSGGNGNDALYGGGGADSLSGGIGNDTLSGDAGLDMLSGGDGNDKAYGGDDADKVSGDAGNDRLWGEAGDDLLFGDSGADTLDGGAGADILNGGSGNDKMAGGIGNDTYVVNASKDVVTELVNEGLDTIESSVALTLSANVEGLILTGTNAINGTGNSLNNSLVGNSAANKLTGGAGNDVIDGGAGNDNLTGGEGTDTYLFGLGGGKDVINNADSDGSADLLVFGQDIDPLDLWFSRSSADLVISVIGAGDRVTLKGWFSFASNRVDQFQLADGQHMEASDVQQLVGAMAFSAAPSSLSALTAAQQASVTAAIDAAWDP